MDSALQQHFDVMGELLLDKDPGVRCVAVQGMINACIFAKQSSVCACGGSCLRLGSDVHRTQPNFFCTRPHTGVCRVLNVFWEMIPLGTTTALLEVCGKFCRKNRVLLRFFAFRKCDVLLPPCNIAGAGERARMGRLLPLRALVRLPRYGIIQSRLRCSRLISPGEIYERSVSRILKRHVYFISFSPQTQPSLSFPPGLRYLLDNALALPAMKLVLPRLANMVHDTSDRVRCDFLDLLLAVKGVSCVFLIAIRMGAKECASSAHTMPPAKFDHLFSLAADAVQGFGRSSSGRWSRWSTSCAAWRRTAIRSPPA